MTDFRALCSALITAWDSSDFNSFKVAAAQARLALTEPVTLPATDNTLSQE